MLSYYTIQVNDLIQRCRSFNPATSSVKDEKDLSDKVIALASSIEAIFTQYCHAIGIDISKSEINELARLRSSLLAETKDFAVITYSIEGDYQFTTSYYRKSKITTNDLQHEVSIKCKVPINKIVILIDNKIFNSDQNFLIKDLNQPIRKIVCRVA